MVLSKRGTQNGGPVQKAVNVRTRLRNAKDDLTLWGWRSQGRGVLLAIGLACLTTFLIFLGHMAGNWLGGWLEDLGAALGMLIGAWGGFVAGALIAEAVGVFFQHWGSL